jgi:hypothetical protein
MSAVDRRERQRVRPKLLRDRPPRHERRPLTMKPTRKPEGDGWVWGQYRVKNAMVWAWKRPRPPSEGRK